MARLHLGLDAYSPREISEKIELAGVAKARLPLAQTGMLAVLAGACASKGAFGAGCLSDTWWHCSDTTKMVLGLL